jgi:hypothetical protein
MFEADNPTFMGGGGSLPGPMHYFVLVLPLATQVYLQHFLPIKEGCYGKN